MGPGSSAVFLGRFAGSGASGVVARFGVEALGFFELVFPDDDAACRIQGGACVHEFPGAGGQAQLVARVAAVPAGERCGVISLASSRVRRKLGVTPMISAARPMV
jgi:hypothetical protein